jgi:D-lactate dehydrogenase (cytochrome)
MREAVPEGVNRRILENKLAEKKATGTTTISKTAGDMIVPFQFLPDMMKLFRENFSDEYDMYIWGHVSDGNMHTNIVPKSSAQSESAREILMKCGRIVIDKYKGSPCSEHGVGKNPVKQALIEYLYMQLGIQQMRDVRRVFDPTNKMPQNIYALAA